MKNKILFIILVSTLFVSCGKIKNVETSESVATSSDATEDIVVVPILNETANTESSAESNIESATNDITVNDTGEFVIDDAVITKTDDGTEVATIKTENNEEVNVVVKTNDNGEKVVDTESTKISVNDNGEVVIKTPITNTPVNTPTHVPSNTPINTPTNIPTTGIPTDVITKIPTVVPTKVPTSIPTVTPTKTPTKVPTVAPTKTPIYTPTSTPTPTTHTHNWVAITKNVHHNEVGHWEYENKPYFVGIYYNGSYINTRPTIHSFYEALKILGMWSTARVNNVVLDQGDNYTDFTFDSSTRTADELNAMEDYYDCGSITTRTVRTEIIEKWYNSWDELSKDIAFYKSEFSLDLSNVKDNCYTKTWIVDTTAYDETVITGYKCSCGATK